MSLLWSFLLLFLTGLAAGFVDAIAGGGGLITVPVFLSLGMGPADALGTNKLQATFGSGSAAWHYGRAGLISWRDSQLGVLFTAASALIGTVFVQQLDPRLLKLMIPWLLVAIALYTLFRPTLGAEQVRPRLRPEVFHVVFGTLLGFYDGFFGPGTGTFWAMAYLLGLGLDLTRATAQTKLMNFTSNAASLLVFLLGNHVYFAAGLVMGAGQLLGARLGSRAVIKRGTRFIRPIFILAVLAITVKLLYQNLR